MRSWVCEACELGFAFLPVFGGRPPSPASTHHTYTRFVSRDGEGLVAQPSFGWISFMFFLCECPGDRITLAILFCCSSADLRTPPHPTTRGRLLLLAPIHRLLFLDKHTPSLCCNARGTSSLGFQPLTKKK
eukprot:RCo051908